MCEGAVKSPHRPSSIASVALLFDTVCVVAGFVVSLRAYLRDDRTDLVVDVPFYLLAAKVLDSCVKYPYTHKQKYHPEKNMRF